MTEPTDRFVQAIEEMAKRIEQLEIANGMWREIMASYGDELTELQVKVEGRNKSAATRRNMTNKDALAVLTGDFAEFDHKEAASRIGLTYAQVYSCRLEFTFKHVHKDLRDAKWKNPWTR